MQVVVAATTERQTSRYDERVDSVVGNIHRQRCRSMGHQQRGVMEICATQEERENPFDNPLPSIVRRQQLS